MENKFQPTTGDTYPQKIFAHQLITVDGLSQFKKQLLEELLAVLRSQNGMMPKKWMKSHEVRRLLKISPGTLQSLKASGVIPYTKMGGVHFTTMTISRKYWNRARPASPKMPDNFPIIYFQTN